MLKQGSALHCPWDLAEYGGYAPFARLFERLPGNIDAGKCFPGGHAAGGFALMAFYFGLRDVHARYARVGLIVALALGMVMGWAQMMRGAHFLSHNLWSAWVVWTFMAVLYHLFPPQPLQRARQA
jgi:membrane-associated PAP2 superfamily phosphatase